MEETWRRIPTRRVGGLMPEAKKKNSTGSLYKSYFRTLYFSRISWAVFWLVFVYFLIWSLPWIPGGLSIDDYTPEFITTIAFAASCLALGLGAGTLRKMLRRKRETLLAWTSLYDEATGLNNRRYFYDRLSLECERSRRYGPSFILLVLQLIPSSRRGEDSGTLGASTLKSAAAAVKGGTRATDVVGLTGKSEFAVLLLGVRPEEAQKAAEKVTEKVTEKIRLSMQAALPGLMATSGLKEPPFLAIGFSTYGTDGDSPDALVDSARLASQQQIDLIPLSAQPAEDTSAGPATPTAA
jgi:diguanylate cyclase (GGDEF)-like protein